MTTIPALDPAEIDYAVRALIVLPEEHWDEAADLLIRITRLAGRIKAVKGRSHPVLGDGSMMGTLAHWPLATRPEADALRQAVALECLSRAVIRHLNGDEQ